MTYAIETRGLVKRFAKGKVTALSGLDLKVRTGTLLGVLGPNGAGKTTAVRILASLMAPDAGYARVGGFDVVQHPHEVRRIIGLTGQYAAVDQELTGVQNISMVARLLGLSRSASKKRAEDLLERFGLADAGGRKARTYSGGMRRRLDLAVSLVGDPSVLYLDEPTTGLDPESRFELWDIVRDLVKSGATVLLTTQYLDEADQLADDIVVIDDGRAIAQGTSEELKAKIDKQTLEIQPAENGALDRTANIVEGLSGKRPVIEGDKLIVQVNDGAFPAMVLRRLDEAGVGVAQLALRQPSLDEVFLSLTGRRAKEKREAESKEEEEASPGGSGPAGHLPPESGPAAPPPPPQPQPQSQAQPQPQTGATTVTEKGPEPKVESTLEVPVVKDQVDATAGQPSLKTAGPTE